jgi:inosine-uridine nucleoside N-ribohydrolase
VNRTRILFDTDPGIDDAMALAMLALDPRAELVGITTVFGNVPIELTTRNALALRELFGIPEVPVARGAARPLVKPAGDFADFVHGANGLGNVELPEPSGALDPRPAAQFIVEMARRHSGELVLVPVGPLTNLALALQLDPELPRHVREVVLMGGAFGTHGHGGNMSPVAEANIFNDPHAADLVATAPWPVTFVGLDVTHEVVMTTGYLDELGARGGPHGTFLRDITRFYEAFYEFRTGGGICCHDATAVACALDASAFTRRPGAVRVVTEGLAAGQTIQSVRGSRFPATDWDARPEQQVCTGVDVARVLADFRRLFPG